MFIYNFKFDKRKFSKFIIVVLTLIAVSLIIASACTIYQASVSVKNDSPTSISISNDNFTEFLKDCHENIDSYVGYNVELSGYVYRMDDFNDNQFVLARTMILDSSNNAVVVGILSECNNASNFKDNDWISIHGVITKGFYHGDIPVVKVTDVRKSDRPDDEYVYPPGMD